MKNSIEKRQGGRPTKYDPKLSYDLLDYFNGAYDQLHHEIVTARTTKSNSQREETKLVANLLPTFERFAIKKGLSLRVLYDWEQRHEEFGAAMEQCRTILKDFLVQNGLLGLYPPQFAQFVCKNLTDLRDVQQIQHAGVVYFLEISTPKIDTGAEDVY